MYFGATVGGSSHLWRQKFPDGAPEQITFGPLEEEGIAMAPDGRSLVTSVGSRRSAIWIHDAAGERAISSEGYAAAPRLSRDATHVFYLLARDFVLSADGWVASSSELRSVDLASGKTNSVLPGVSVTDYDVSRDEKKSPSRRRKALESRTSGWHPSTGAHRRARSPKAEIRCRSALTETPLPVARQEHECAGANQQRRNRAGARDDGPGPSQVRRVARRPVGGLLLTWVWRRSRKRDARGPRARWRAEEDLS